MSSLDSTSTLAEIKAAYADNASYQEDVSTTKALAFITACRLLLLKLPKRVAAPGDEEVELEPRVLQGQLAEAQRWYAAQKAVASQKRIRHVDFGNFRD